LNPVKQGKRGGGIEHHTGGGEIERDRINRLRFLRDTRHKKRLTGVREQDEIKSRS